MLFGSSQLPRPLYLDSQKLPPGYGRLQANLDEELEPDESKQWLLKLKLED
jgi:hypothetical protein